MPLNSLQKDACEATVLGFFFTHVKEKENIQQKVHTNVQHQQFFSGRINLAKFL